MRVSLFFNGDAGDGASLDEIHATLDRHGHELVRVVEREDDSARLLGAPTDLVVAAGGDGTVAAAACAVAGRRIPMAILPVGTANNIATSLGADGSIEEVIRGWSTAQRRPLDLGIARGTWGERRFVEAVGAGLVPAGIDAATARRVDADVSPDTKLARAVSTYRDVLSRLEPRRSTVTLDGIRLTGEFLVLEVLNIRSIGPNLVLSPDVSPSDGFFSVVLAGEEHREQIADYLERRLEGHTATLALPALRARQVDIRAPDRIHLDDETCCPDSIETVSMDITPAAVELLI